MSTSVFSTYVSLLRFTLKRQDGVGRLVNGFFLLVAAGSVFLGFLVPDLKAMGHQLLLISIAGILLSHWFFICIGLMLQNTPANACTVPFLHARLQRLSGFLAFSMSCLFAGLCAFFYGHFVLVFCISLMTLTMFMSTNVYLYLLYFVGLGTSRFWLPFFQQSEQGLLPMVSMMAISFSYAFTCLRLSFWRGGDAHFKVFKSMKHLLRQLNPSDQANKGWEQIEWLHKIITYPYFCELRSATKSGSLKASTVSAQANVNRRLLSLGFSPGLHWSVDLLYIFVNLFLACMVVYLETKNALPFTLKAVILACPVMSGFSLAMSCKMSLYQTRREQALLLLAPIIPASTALNPYLIQILWRRYVQSWLISATAVGLVLLLGISQGVEHMAVWTMGLVMSPLFFIYVLRDYSLLNQNAVNEVGVIALALFIVAACILLSWAKGENFVFAATGMTLFVLGAAYFGVRRWRSLRSGHALLPVGHRHC